MSQDPFMQFIEEESRKADEEWRQRQEDEAFKYNPRVSSRPGQPLEVEVDLPDNHTPDQMFESMIEAAKLLGFDTGTGFGK